MRILTTILLLALLQTTAARTIPVGKDQVIHSLRKGLELAAEGDTIVLHPGVYREGNIIINKPLSLIGLNGPVLDGEGKHELLTVSGTHITIRGLRFRNSGYSSVNDLSSINLVDAEYVQIENNEIENAYFAIHLANTRNSIIRENMIRGNALSEQTSGNGIHLWKCDNILIEHNEVQGHRDGIYFEFVTNSTIRNNLSTRNVRYGLHFMFSNNDAYLANTFRENGAGVAVMFSKKVLMIRNHFDRNWGPSAYGILLKEISDSEIYGNVFRQNTVGIMMEGTNRIQVQRNHFKANGWAMKVQASCSDNTFLLNNFMGNTFDVATNGTMMLNRYYRNYWDKYEGYDLDRDGLGDIAYHPVSMYAMIIEQNPNSLLLLRSFIVSLLERAEKAIPSLTPETLADEQPKMKPYHD